MQPGTNLIRKSFRIGAVVPKSTYSELCEPSSVANGNRQAYQSFQSTNRATTQVADLKHFKLRTS